MSITPKFHCSPSELVTVTELVIGSAQDNKTKIVEKRPKIADPYLPNLLTRVIADKQKYIGMDSAKNLRSATAGVMSIMIPAKNDLSEFKTDLKVDFKENKARNDEILNMLGFKKYYTSVTRNNQQGTIDLLAQFKLNLTADLEAEIIDKGMSPGLITRIKGYADSLDSSNLTQEAAKNHRPELTAEATKEFNWVYDEIIGVCESCQKVFKDNEAKKNLFVFSKILSTLRGGNHGGGNNDTNQTPPAPNA